jgi:hypothetical protein
MHGCDDDEVSEHKVWTAAHYPVRHHCGATMDLNAVSHGCERWHCKSCSEYQIREVPRAGYTEPAWSAGSSFDAHVANTKRIGPLPVASATCALCKAPLTATDSSIGLGIAAHQERCFGPGDKVRWWPYGLDEDPRLSPFVDGVVLDFGRTYLRVDYITGNLFGHIKPSIGGVYDWSVSPGMLRHRDKPHAFVRGAAIGPCRLGPPDETCMVCQRDPRNDMHSIPRPGQEVVSGPLFRCQGYRDGKQCEVRSGPPAAAGYLCPEHECLTSPIPTVELLIDGLSSSMCYERWAANKIRIERGKALVHDMTPSQIAEGRRAFIALVSPMRTRQLRAKIAAAREQERCRVVVDLQDVEELTW